MPTEISLDAPLTEANALEQAESFIRSIPEYPDSFAGRGIVICGGGLRYFTNAWVCIHILRHLGCRLPIQIWHLGPQEMDQQMKALVAPLGVECMDGLEVRKRHPARILKGWELKPYAILHSPFREVLLLDADNVPVVNPEFLFESPEYAATGALFWPDFGRLAPSRLIWQLCGVAYRDEPEFETGQIFVDKERCWRALQLTMWYNEHSDFFYRHIHGDKETFHLAWRKLGQEYAMPPYPVGRLFWTMLQRDFQGRPLFQHRNFDKWSLFLTNKTVPRFQHEKECKGFLEDLRQRWPGRLNFNLAKKSDREREAAATITTTLYQYRRVGHDERPMSFLPTGCVGQGAAGCEVFWDVRALNGDIHLDLLSENELTCTLKLDGDGVWKGRWERFEQMPIELIPLNQHSPPVTG